jgi:acetyl coenzyme A synthetase (ADP forming)-like protein
MAVMPSSSLSCFFDPQVVAVVGASRRRGRIGTEIFRSILAAGYRGTVVPVNPGASAVEGVMTYARVTDIPLKVDLVVIAVPCEQVEGVIDDCVRKQVKGVVVISAGFGETGGDGRAREVAIVAKVRAAGIRMVGPNCMGLINTHPEVSLNATFSTVYPPQGRLALSTQSGALGLAILDYARRLNIGLSSFVSIGNKADVSTNDLIEQWEHDPATDVILLYVESFGNPRKFSQLARRVGRRKPIVAVKSGRSSAGARAASSHTGALAARDVVVDALFRQAGVIRTDTLEELFDVANLLAHQPMPRGRRVAILTNAGGPAIMAADACEARGLQIVSLGEETRAALREFLPAAASVGNPVDMLASASGEHYRRAIELLLRDEGVDSLLVIFIPPLVTETAEVAAALRAATRETFGKPVLASFMAAQGAPPELGTIPAYVFPESAATALARAVLHGEWRARPAGGTPTLADIRRCDAQAVVEHVVERGGGWLEPTEAQEVVRAYGIKVAEIVSVTREDDAVAAADAMGYPVVLKASGPGILHKSDVGAVKVGIADAASLRDCWRAMRTQLGTQMAAGVVQPMITGGVEMMIGVTQDATFGHVLVCGTGGTLVELFSDVAVRLHPLTDLDAQEMIESLKGKALLRGYRGSSALDEAALADALLRVSALVDACPRIVEMDLNPVKVLPIGLSAVDVRIRVR